MINSLLTRVFGSRNERLLKQLDRLVVRNNALEPELQKLSDEELKAKTPEFQKRVAEGEALDKILPEAFATVVEAADRVLGMRPYHVQIMGGAALHLGKPAQIAPGRGGHIGHESGGQLLRKHAQPGLELRVRLPQQDKAGQVADRCEPRHVSLRMVWSMSSTVCRTLALAA